MKNATQYKGLAAFGALVFGLALSTAAFAAKTEAPAFGSKCATCHENVVEEFGKTRHGKTWGATNDGKRDCESCHGNADKHVVENSKETIIRFGKTSKNEASQQAGQCLTCHQKQTPSLSMWNVGAHAKNDIACASCHGVHAEKNPRDAETCFACHKDKKAAASKLSHHPIKEGKVSCADCHNPHGTMSHGMIKADNVNQLCYKCHADKRGPFIWEHDPVEENCLTCHNPHGTNHHGLLNAPVPFLCRNCHTGHGSTSSSPSGETNNTNLRTFNRVTIPSGMNLGSGPNSVKVFLGQGCLNCHSRIHGSNGSSRALVR